MVCHEERPRVEQGQDHEDSGPVATLIWYTILSPTRVAPRVSREWSIFRHRPVKTYSRTIGSTTGVQNPRLVVHVSLLVYNKLLYSERRESLRVRTTCQTPRLNPRFELRPSRNNIHDTFHRDQAGYDKMNVVPVKIFCWEKYVEESPCLSRFVPKSTTSRQERNFVRALLKTSSCYWTPIITSPPSTTLLKFWSKAPLKNLRNHSLSLRPW